MEFAGVPHGAIEDLPRSARAAGLEVVEADGFFCTQDPELGFGIHAGTLAAARERALKAGIFSPMATYSVEPTRDTLHGIFSRDWPTNSFNLR